MSSSNNFELKKYLESKDFGSEKLFVQTSFGPNTFESDKILGSNDLGQKTFFVKKIGSQKIWSKVLRLKNKASKIIRSNKILFLKN